MPTTEKYLQAGTWTTLLGASLNSLANNGLALSSALDNTQGGGGADGYTFCELELVWSHAVAPTANTGISVWFVKLGSDGTTYEDGGDGTTTPAKMSATVFAVRSVTTSQRVVRHVWMPPGVLKALLKNDGTGQAMAASGNTLKIRPATSQGV